jgi:hypothetical protein
MNDKNTEKCDIKKQINRPLLDGPVQKIKLFEHEGHIAEKKIIKKEITKKKNPGKDARGYRKQFFFLINVMRYEMIKQHRTTYRTDIGHLPVKEGELR